MAGRHRDHVGLVYDQKGRFGLPEGQTAGRNPARARASLGYTDIFPRENAPSAAPQLGAAGT